MQVLLSAQLDVSFYCQCKDEDIDMFMFKRAGLTYKQVGEKFEVHPTQVGIRGKKVERFIYMAQSRFGRPKKSTAMGTKT